MTQDNMFFEGEGDAWYRRNRVALETIGTGHTIDFPSRAVSMLNENTPLNSILELGCSNGSRLGFLQGILGAEKRFTGVDASQEAIEAGRRDFPGIELHHGLLNQLSIENQFDCVIVNFVLHWIDRSLLARSIAEIDRVVKDGGFLILGDFAPDFVQRRRYHHLQNVEVFTYKQDYPAIFKSLGTYRTVQRHCFNHDLSTHPLVPTNSSNRAFCEVLEKSTQGFYPEIKP